MQDGIPAGDWAVPGAAADADRDEPRPDQPPVTERPEAAPAAAAIREPVPSVALRPMTVADILDGGFRVVKARPARILGLTAAFVIPVQVLASWLQRDVLAAGFTETWGLDDPTVGATAGPDLDLFASLLLLLVIPALALVCVAAAVAYTLVAWSAGRDPAVGELFGLIGRKWWALLASWVLVHLAEGVGALACNISIPFVMALFVVTAPVIGAEGLGPGKAMARSLALTRKRYWRTLGIALLIGLVGTMLGFALSGLWQLLGTELDIDAGWALVAFGGILGQLVVTPFTAGATALLYLDLRVRTEGLDLEIATRELLDRAA